jgi:DNA-binding transcriptional LysR family regulator
MDKIQLMTAFIVVAEEQNFAAAARRLGTSPASITRAIASLEKYLGVKLVQRTTRSVRLTEAAGRYLDDVRVIMSKVEEAHESASSAHSVLRGHLNVTAPALFGVSYVTPCIAEYLERFPAMSVSGYFLDRVVDLTDEGIDVAIRIGASSDDNLESTCVGMVRQVLCASPGYLAARGTPRHPDDLADHSIIAARGVSPELKWRFRCGAQNLIVDVTPRLTVTSNDAAIKAATLGAGISRLISYQVAAHVADERLALVLADYEEPPWPVRVVWGNTSSKVREFVQILVRRLSKADAFDHAYQI